MAGVPGRSGRKADPDAARRLRADDPQRFLKWIDLPPEGNTNDVPEMPKAPDLWHEDGQWTVRAQDMWNRLWRSPQSTKWQPELHPMIERYIFIYEKLWLTGSYTPAELTAMQKIEDDMGLTSKAMSHLYWRIQAPTEEVAPELASVSVIEAATKDRRKNIEY